MFRRLKPLADRRRPPSAVASMWYVRGVLPPSRRDNSDDLQTRVPELEARLTKGMNLGSNPRHPASIHRRTIEAPGFRATRVPRRETTAAELGAAGGLVSGQSIRHSRA